MIEVVENKEFIIIPSDFENDWRHWLENPKYNINYEIILISLNKSY